MGEQEKRSCPIHNLVARFGKALQMNLTDLDDKQEGASRWIVLGYFDTLQLYPLPSSIEVEETQSRNQLNAMWEHSIEISEKLNGEFYYHPIHMIPALSKHGDKAGSRLDKECHTDFPFMFFTLVQGATRDSSEIQRRVRLIATSSGVDNHVGIHFYHTLELSDLIVICMSDSLLDLLKILNKMHNDSSISDSDTFVAINYEFLKERRWESRRITRDLEAEIYVSTRYVIKDVKSKEAFLKTLFNPNQINQCAYFTTGIEDLHVVQNKIAISYFLTYLYNILFNINIAPLCRDACSSCMTQIGLPDPDGDDQVPKENTGSQGDQGPGAQEDGDDQLQSKNQILIDQCSRLLTRFQNECTNAIKSCQIERRDISWIKPARNLYNALLDMSRNCILDGFCYLILDAAAVFQREIRIRGFLTGENTMSSQQLELVQRFVRGWGTLIEHSTRVDGRFIQMPGFTPLLCEIPAHLLEYYLAFANQCVQAMRTCTSRGENVAFLFVPKICRRMKVEPIFLNDTDSGKHLLYMDIPLDMLYNPLSVMCCICHEVAHFVGGDLRRRSLRTKHLTLAIANELSNQLRVKDPAAVFFLYRSLLLQHDDGNNLLINLKAILLGKVKLFLESSELFDAFTKKYLDTLKDSHTEESLVRARINLYARRNALAFNSECFYELMENIAYLFQECYADVAMISFLRLSKKTYLLMAQSELEEMKANSPDLRNNSKYYIIVQRWSALLRINGLWSEYDDAFPMSELKGNELYSNQNNLMKMFMEDICTSCNPKTWGRRGTETCPIYNTSESFNLLSAYLNKCYSGIRDYLNSKDYKARRETQRIDDECIYNMAISPQLDYDYLDQVINQYRNDLLSELEKGDFAQ